MSASEVGAVAGARAGRFGRLAAAIERILDLVTAAMILVLAVSLIWQVFGRYVIGQAPSWSEELARFMIVWTAMLGSAAALREGGHIAVNVVVDRLPPRARAAVLALRDAAVVACCGMLVWYGTTFVELMSFKLSPAFEISMSWPYAALPVGAALILVMVVLSRLAGAPFTSNAEEDLW